MLKKLSQYIQFDGLAPRSSRFEGGKSAKLSDSFDFISLIKAWREIAGEKLSEHTIPLKNQNGTLIVLSNHSAFANELSFLYSNLIASLREEFHHPVLILHGFLPIQQ